MKIYFKLFILFFINTLVLRIAFAISNQNLLENVPVLDLIYTLFFGFRFDFVIAGCLAFIFLHLSWFINKKNGLIQFFIITAVFFLTCLQASDIMYFKESGRHLTYEVSDLHSDFVSLVLTALTHFTLLFILAFIFIFILSLAVIKFFKKNNLPKSPLKMGIISLITLVLTVLFIRGGFRHIPQSPSLAFKLSNPQLANLALNGSYSALYSLANTKGNLRKTELPSYTKAQLSALLKNLYPKETPLTEYQLKSKPNIIMIFLESWPTKLMSSYGFFKETTPFFTELMNKSIAPIAMIAGGHRTTEGLFSSLCSFQNPLGQTVAKTKLEHFDYNCLPKILRNQGWKTAFFQGSLSETSGTGNFAQMLGFEVSEGKEHIKNHKFDLNSWGVHDPDLYNHAFSFMNQEEQPFFIGINTNSTHDLSLPSQFQPVFGASNQLEQKLSVLNFADHSLKQFFNSVEKKYPNTLWLIFSDHTAGLQGNILEEYLIPFVMYHKDLKPLRVDQIMSHRDIGPSLLYTLSLGSLGKHFTGKNILVQTPKLFADFYHNGTMAWVEKDLMTLTPLNSPKASSVYQLNFKNLGSFKKINSKVMDLDHTPLIFTSYLQELLFNGNTIEFNNSYK